MSEPISNHDGKSEHVSTNQETDLDSANEKTHLTKTISQDTSNIIQTGPESVNEAWKMIKMLDFWLFGVTFVLGCSVGTVVSGNIGTYLRSFRQEEQLHKIMTIAPWCYLTVKIIVGFISDLLIDKIPRVWFWVFFSISRVVVFSIFVFYAEEIIMMHIVAYFSFALMGVIFITGPVLAAESFGLQYFAVSFGSILLIQGFFMLLIQFIFGLLYDMNVTDEATHTCYGMQCFFVTSCLLCVLSIITAVTSVALCLRRRKVGQ